MGTLRASLVVLGALLVLGAAGAGSGASAAASGYQDALHQVMPGDDLHLIAGYYYGDARQWERIWEANRDRIRNPNRIQRGALLRIPDATVPAETYVDFVARARRASGAPGKAEVRSPGEGSSAAPGPETAPPAREASGPREGAAGPAAQPASPAGPRP
jgi:hypothetical protein